MTDETLTVKQLLLRCRICVVYWTQDVKRNTIPKSNICSHIDPIHIEAFAEFSGRLWDAMNKPGEEISDKIAMNNWGLNETLKFLESEVALFEKKTDN